MAGTSLEDLRVLQAAEAVSDALWDQAMVWTDFAKNTVGSQLVRAADSIGANIAEAFGRYHYGEKLQFLYYARGSLYETKYWVNRALRRQLLSQQNGETYASDLTGLAHQLNAFVRSLKSQRSGQAGSATLKEEAEVYAVDEMTTSDFIPSTEIDWLSSDPSAPLPQSLISYLKSQTTDANSHDH